MSSNIYIPGKRFNRLIVQWRSITINYTIISLTFNIACLTAILDLYGLRVSHFFYKKWTIENFYIYWVIFQYSVRTSTAAAPPQFCKTYWPEASFWSNFSSELHNSNDCKIWLIAVIWNWIVYQLRLLLHFLQATDEVILKMADGEWWHSSIRVLTANSSDVQLQL